jgi:hypothetical protein
MYFLFMPEQSFNDNYLTQKIVIKWKIRKNTMATKMPYKTLLGRD